MKNRIPDKELAALVDAYMERADLRDKDDPVDDVARVIAEHFSDLPRGALEDLAHAVLSARYGGTAVYIKGNPATAIRAAAARGLSFKQLEAMFPDHGRSILRRYHKEANDARQKK